MQSPKSAHEGFPKGSRSVGHPLEIVLFIVPGDWLNLTLVIWIYQQELSVELLNGTCLTIVVGCFIILVSNKLSE